MAKGVEVDEVGGSVVLENKVSQCGLSCIVVVFLPNFADIALFVRVW